MKTVLGIDNGTQSTKVFFYDYEQKKVVATASAPHDLRSGDDGSREQEADWWITALKKSLEQIDPDIKQTVQAIGVSGQQHGFVPVDKDGNVLYSVKLWCDTSTAGECTELTDAFGDDEKLLKEVGNLIMPGYTASKVLWFKKAKPELFKKMHMVLLPHDYLNYYLTGEFTMEYGDASGTGFLDVRNRIWHTDLMKKIDPDLPAKFPALIESDQPAGKLTAARAAELGLPAGVPVSSGGGDNMMGAIGTGTVEDGVLTMSMGTSGTLYGYSDKPVVDPGGILAAFCSSTGGWLPLLCTMNCTVATELARKLFDYDVVNFDKLAEKVEPGSEGVVMLPFFNGERIPNLPKGKGSIMGLNMTNFRKETVARASMESAVFGMRIGLEQFMELGFKAREIRLIGGGANSPLWRQMAADILGLPVKTPLNKESAAFGGALQALWLLQGGGKAALENLIGEHVQLNEEQIHQPNPAVKEAYDKAYAQYMEYLGNLAPLYK